MSNETTPVDIPEFSQDLSPAHLEMSRREFFKIMGAGFVAASLAACGVRQGVDPIPLATAFPDVKPTAAPLPTATLVKEFIQRPTPEAFGGSQQVNLVAWKEFYDRAEISASKIDGIQSVSVSSQVINSEGKYQALGDAAIAKNGLTTHTDVFLRPDGTVMTLPTKASPLLGWQFDTKTDDAVLADTPGNIFARVTKEGKTSEMAYGTVTSDTGLFVVDNRGNRLPDVSFAQNQPLLLGANAVVDKAGRPQVIKIQISPGRFGYVSPPDFGNFNLSGASKKSAKTEISVPPYSENVYAFDDTSWIFAAEKVVYPNLSIGLAKRNQGGVTIVNKLEPGATPATGFDYTKVWGVGVSLNGEKAIGVTLNFNSDAAAKADKADPRGYGGAMLFADPLDPANKSFGFELTQKAVMRVRGSPFQLKNIGKLEPNKDFSVLFLDDDVLIVDHATGKSDQLPIKKSELVRDGRIRTGLYVYPQSDFTLKLLSLFPRP